jgi:hypothetical protein
MTTCCPAAVAPIMLSGLAGRDDIWAGDGAMIRFSAVTARTCCGARGKRHPERWPGADIFVFTDGEGFDEIADFGESDRIDLRAVSSIAEFTDLQDTATDSPDGCGSIPERAKFCSGMSASLTSI